MLFLGRQVWDGSRDSRFAYLEWGGIMGQQVCVLRVGGVMGQQLCMLRVGRGHGTARLCAENGEGSWDSSFAC